MMPSDMEIAVTPCFTTHKPTAWDPLASAPGFFLSHGRKRCEVKGCGKGLLILLRRNVRLSAPVQILPNRRSWAIILAILLSDMLVSKRVRISPIAVDAHSSSTTV